MPATPCLDDNELSELVARRLEPEDEARAQAHLAECDACAELLATVAPERSMPERVGRYRVVKLVGMGACGSVFRAHDPSLGRDVAVKLLNGDAGDHVLLAEAQSLARLAHPNVVAIHDVGKHEEQVFIAMELAGTSLRRWLKEAPRAQREVLKVLMQAGEGLAAAHATGLVHRDVKPDNILISRDGRALVTDFGLARSEPGGDALRDDTPVDTATVSAAGRLIGTPAYMAPEQLRGALADERADQYAFCVTSFEALTGRRPRSAQVLGTLRSEAERETIDAAAAATLPRWLWRILRRGLRADPERRWPGMRPLLTALAAGPPLARPGVRAAIGAGAAGALLVGSLAWGIVATSRQRARAERRFSDVRKLAGGLLFELDKAIETLPGSTAARKLVVTRAQEYLDSLASEARGDVELQRELATAYEKLSDIQGGSNANLGDTDGARRSLARAIAIRRELARHPGSDDDVAALAGAMISDGYLRMPDPAAIEELREAVALRTKLAAADPKRRRLLANAELALGKGYAEIGNYPATIEHERAAFVIYEQLVLENPGRVEDQRNAALGAKYLGAVLQKTGDAAAAIDLYRRAIGWDGMRVAAAPFDMQARLDLSFSVASLANALQGARQLEEAAAGFRLALALRETVAGADPANQLARATVARAHRSLGLVLGDMGDVGGKIAELRRAAETYEALVKSDPGDVLLAGKLAETWVDLADSEVAMSLRVDRGPHLEAARAFGERARALLAGIQPRSAQQIENLVRAAATVATSESLLARGP